MSHEDDDGSGFFVCRKEDASQFILSGHSFVLDCRSVVGAFDFDFVDDMDIVMGEPGFDCLDRGLDVASGVVLFFHRGDVVEDEVIECLGVHIDEFGGCSVEGVAEGAQSSEVDVGGGFGASGDVMVPSGDVFVIEEGGVFFLLRHERVKDLGVYKEIGSEPVRVQVPPGPPSIIVTATVINVPRAGFEPWVCAVSKRY